MIGWGKVEIEVIAKYSTHRAPLGVENETIEVSRLFKSVSVLKSKQIT